MKSQFLLQKTLLSVGLSFTAATPLHAQLNGSFGLDMGGDSSTGRITAAETITDISTYGVGVFPQGWRTPNLDIANMIAPVSQFTGVNNNGTNVATLDLIPLRTTSLQLVDPVTNVVTAVDGKNLYNSDGTLTGDRVVTGGTNKLRFDTSSALYPNFNSTVANWSTFAFSHQGTPSAWISTHPTLGSSWTSATGSISLWANSNVSGSRPQLTVNTNGRVGIGTESPLATLDIAGTGNVRSSMFFNYSDVEAGAITQVGGTMYYDARITTYSSGSIAHIFRSLNTGGSLLYVTHGGNVYAQGSFTPSDRRLKSEVEPLTYGLETIMKLEPHEYNQVQSIEMKEGEPVVSDLLKEKKHSIGFIAQDLYGIVPEAVSKPVDDQNEIWAVDYTKIVPILTKSVQELNTKITQLEVENNELKKLASEIKELKTLVAALEEKSNESVTVSLIK